MIKRIIIILSVIFCALNILMADNDQADNPVSFNEDRSEYFRHEVNFNMTHQQIISYLTHKEYAEKKKNEDLGARYILNLVEPFDRKFDSSIGETWIKLSTSDKNKYRIEWFMRNRRSISPRDICNYINIDDLIQKARLAEEKYKHRAQRTKIAFDNIMPDTPFLLSVEKTYSMADVKPVKPLPKIENEPEVAEKVKISASPAASKKSAKSKKSQKAKTVASKNKNKKQKKNQMSVKKTDDVKPPKSESELTGLKPRNLNVEEVKAVIQKDKSTSADLNSVNTQIENLQTKITNLRKQLNNTAAEIDSLRNYKKKDSE